MLLNNILLIMSSLLATTFAQCPIYWWPIANVGPSTTFFTEVMKGANIVALAGATTLGATYLTGTDRLAAPRRALSLLGVNNLILPTDTYFCSGAFTITVFVRQVTVIAGTIVDFLDIAGTNGVRFELSATTTLRLIVTGAAAQPSVSAAFTAPADGAWQFYAVSYTGAASTPSFYTSPVVGATAPTMLPGTLQIATAPTCTAMNRAVIGSLTTGLVPLTGDAVVNNVNDLKIYNFGLSTAQVQDRYRAEVATRVFTCSSSSINPQYLYILLVAVIACFL